MLQRVSLKLTDYPLVGNHVLASHTINPRLNLPLTPTALSSDPYVQTF